MKTKIIIVLLFLFLLTGCWDRRELNEIGIVLGTGMDKNKETDEIFLTAQIVRPSALAQNRTTNESAVEVVTARGHTIFQAIRNLTQKLDRRSFFAHNKVLIINESFAKDGLKPFLDFFQRSQEMNRLIWIVIAKNSTAEEVLGVKHGIENLQASYLESIIDRKRSSSEVIVKNLLEFIKVKSDEGIHPTTGAMEVIHQTPTPVQKRDKALIKGIKLSGTAVFKEDKLVGYLNDVETSGVKWVLGDIKGGIINVPSPKKKGNLITTEIESTSSKIESKITEEGKYSFTIKINGKSDVAEHQGDFNTMNVKLFEKIEIETEKVIKKRVEEAIEKLQKEIGSDILGFGKALSEQHPKEWKDIKDKWYDIFPDVKYVVEVDIELKRIGLLFKPVEAEE